KGHSAEALEELRRANTAFEKLGDVHSLAVTKGQIADILYARGELRAARKIRTEEELPTYEKLGDVRSLAVTKGQIADILYARRPLSRAQDQNRGTAAHVREARRRALTRRDQWANCRHPQRAQRPRRRAQEQIRERAAHLREARGRALARHDQGANCRHPLR